METDFQEDLQQEPETEVPEVLQASRVPQVFRCSQCNSTHLKLLGIFDDMTLMVCCENPACGILSYFPLKTPETTKAPEKKKEASYCG